MEHKAQGSKPKLQLFIKYPHHIAFGEAYHIALLAYCLHFGFNQDQTEKYEIRIHEPDKNEDQKEKTSVINRFDYAHIVITVFLTYEEPNDESKKKRPEEKAKIEATKKSRKSFFTRLCPCCIESRECTEQVFKKESKSDFFIELYETASIINFCIQKYALHPLSRIHFNDTLISIQLLHYFMGMHSCRIEWIQNGREIEDQFSKFISDEYGLDRKSQKIIIWIRNKKTKEKEHRPEGNLSVEQFRLIKNHINQLTKNHNNLLMGNKFEDEINFSDSGKKGCCVLRDYYLKSAFKTQCDMLNGKVYKQEDVSIAGQLMFFYVLKKYFNANWAVGNDSGAMHGPAFIGITTMIFNLQEPKFQKRMHILSSQIPTLEHIAKQNSDSKPFEPTCKILNQLLTAPSALRQQNLLAPASSLQLIEQLIKKIEKWDITNSSCVSRYGFSPQ